MRVALKTSISLIAVACLAACASNKPPPGDDAPTLATLSQRSVPVDKDRRVQSDETQAIAAYRKFLDSTPKAGLAPQRAEAMRRLGDLEMVAADNRSATSTNGAAPGASTRVSTTVRRFSSTASRSARAASEARRSRPHRSSSKDTPRSIE